MNSQLDISSYPESGEEAFGYRLVCLTVAAAAADALGWMTESVRDVGELRERFGTDWLTDYQDWSNPEGESRPYLAPVRGGDYSDDTQLFLATARSLREDGTLDADYFTRWELPAWLDYARGADAANLSAARAFRDRKAAWNKNFHTYTRQGEACDYRDAEDNGAAKRALPIALANLTDPERLTDEIWRSTVITHGHPRAAVGALLYAHAILLCFIHRHSLTRDDLAHQLTELLEGAAPPAEPEFEQWRAVWDGRGGTTFGNLWEKMAQEAAADLACLAELPADDERATRRYMEYLGCFRPETKNCGTGTVLASLAIATQKRENVKQALPWAANQLGSDTGAISTFTAGLCGSIHGFDFAHNARFYDMQDYTAVSHLTSYLGGIAERLFPPNPIEPYQPQKTLRHFPLLTDLLKTGDLSEGQWVFHPIMSEGKIKKIETRPLLNQPDEHVRLVRVAFDNAQSCQFRSYAAG